MEELIEWIPFVSHSDYENPLSSFLQGKNVKPLTTQTGPRNQKSKNHPDSTVTGRWPASRFSGPQQDPAVIDSDNSEQSPREQPGPATQNPHHLKWTPGSLGLVTPKKLETGAAPPGRPGHQAESGRAGGRAAHSDHHETESVWPGGRGSTVQVTDGHGAGQL